MILNQDKVPVNLEEAVQILKEGLESVDLLDIKKPKFDAAQMHFTIGMYIRNEWSMWDKKSILVQWFARTYGIDHADDVSGIILDCLVVDIRGEPRRDKILAGKFIQHWKNQKNQ